MILLIKTKSYRNVLLSNAERYRDDVGLLSQTRSQTSRRTSSYCSDMEISKNDAVKEEFLFDEELVAARTTLETF